MVGSAFRTEQSIHFIVNYKGEEMRRESNSNQNNDNDMNKIENEGRKEC